MSLREEIVCKISRVKPFRIQFKIMHQGSLGKWNNRLYVYNCNYSRRFIGAVHMIENWLGQQGHLHPEEPGT